MPSASAGALPPVCYKDPALFAGPPEAWLCAGALRAFIQPNSKAQILITIIFRTKGSENLSGVSSINSGKAKN